MYTSLVDGKLNVLNSDIQLQILYLENVLWQNILKTQMIWYKIKLVEEELHVMGKQLLLANEFTKYVSSFEFCDSNTMIMINEKNNSKQCNMI